MDTVCVFFCVAVVIGAICRLIAAQAKTKKEDELLERNPEAWKKVKELELERKDRNRRAGLGAAITIAKIFLKRR